MKIIKIKNCGNKCEYFQIIQLALMHVFECSHPPIQKEGIIRRRLVGDDLKRDFPKWCPLEDYKK